MRLCIVSTAKLRLRQLLLSAGRRTVLGRCFETLPIQYKRIASDRNNDADDEDYAPGGQAAKRQKKKPAAKKTGLAVMKQSG